ncbi:U-box domain-containing protein 33-like isoform X1 [Zingiber officinale]|uniref:U-box domain-containing protein 33-like isoform X1 n=2 Tax=Zingiber officinale TaxID=94328 RepID=UPI001C4C8A40|nr:U-box domain-containing protein 33-like isoform X1 [Zingiber officinale]
MASRQVRGMGGFESFSSTRSSGVTEIEEEAVPLAPPAEEKLYVAVAAELKAGKATLFWAIQNSNRDRTIVLAHVHVPAKTIPMMGGKFPESCLTTQQVNAYRMLERDKMNKSLNAYINLCSEMKVKVEKVVIEMDDIANGLVELIELHCITKLVMGAAADKHYSRKMKDVKSKTAINVKQLANPLCKIYFICKGHLIYTRESTSHASWMARSPMYSQSSMDRSSEQSRVPSLSPRQSSMGSLNEQSRAPNVFMRQTESLSSYISTTEDFSRQTSSSSFGDRNVVELPPALLVRTPHSRSIGGSSVDPWEGITRSSYTSGRSSLNYEEISNATPSVANYDESEAGSVILPSLNDKELPFSPPNQDREHDVSDEEVYKKLQEALKEAENLKNEAYEEYCKRQKAEMNAVLALQKVKASESKYAKEARLRKEIEEMLAVEKLQLEKLEGQHSEISERLKKAVEEKVKLELQITESENAAIDYEKKLSEAHGLLRSLQSDYDALQQEHDKAVREVEELLQKRDQTACILGSFNSEFSALELKKATEDFSNDLKIGEGGFGSVYKGFLRNTTVAIKLLHPQSMQGRSEFHQEVAILSRVRHPNLVTLIGACSETLALVYEFLPNGSLQDRLACANNSEPLTWQVRTRVIAEICSALVFLHSNNPHPIVHGDLKPDNILLDANYVSKIGDFGISRLLDQSSMHATLYHNTTNPKGTFAYMDPEYVTTGELTPQSDVYSFGIIILQLLTGKPPVGIARVVEVYMNEEKLHEIIDKSAGNWPFVQANQLAHLGLRCCAISRKNRPDLAGQVWKTVEPLMKVASLSTTTQSSKSFSDRIPHYFICPIFQDIMRNPHIATDGFTYEAEAMRGWIDSGHDTSPMTNLKLLNCELIPNHALRSAIQEWLQSQPQQFL